MKSRAAWTTCSVLLIAVVLLGLRFAIPAYQQHNAAANVRNLGMFVESRYSGPAWAHSFIDRRISPESWLNFFYEPVVASQLSGLQLDANRSDSLFLNLARLPQLRMLAVDGPAVTDRHAKAIEDLTSLRQLGLVNTSVTDVGVQSFRNLKKLVILQLNGAKITDRAIDTLVELPALEVLHLDNTGITDAGLDQLARLKSLRELSISQTDTSDAAIDRLHGAIPDVQITDD